MEDQMINGFGTLASYGALGIVSVYFMVKDWTLSKKIEEALAEFTLAFKLLAAKIEE